MGTSTYSPTSATTFSLLHNMLVHFNLPLLPPNSLHFSPAASFPPPPYLSTHTCVPLYQVLPLQTKLFTSSYLGSVWHPPILLCCTTHTLSSCSAHLTPLYVFKEPVDHVLSLNWNLTPSWPIVHSSNLTSCHHPVPHEGSCPGRTGRSRMGWWIKLDRLRRRKRKASATWWSWSTLFNPSVTCMKFEIAINIMK